MKAEALAREFHETYERLAPSYDYKTRDESAVPWEDVPENNRNLMVAVCDEILNHHGGPLQRIEDDHSFASAGRMGLLVYQGALEAAEGDENMAMIVLMGYFAGIARGSRSDD